MGIVNVTPDSFSDGGDHEDPAAAVAHGERLLTEGADLLDVGGESTRPGAAAVSPAEELARVRPVIQRLSVEPVPVAVDTRRPTVAAACLEAGASIVNDVSGFRDPAMVQVVAASECGVIIMHMLGNPESMQDDPRYDDVVVEVGGYLLAQAAVLEAAGVARERIAIDPGIGFGKTLEHNLALLRGTRELADLGYPLVVGASRKRFIGEITGEADPRGRVGGSVAAALAVAERGAAALRVHDVAATVQAFALGSALRS
ncbi:MAG: dihydropteroate synthase [Coriobacteriia bacterium]|nr:dihydropteroate synthase [Coriobacteriia bacterium]